MGTMTVYYGNNVNDAIEAWRQDCAEIYPNIEIAWALLPSFVNTADDIDYWRLQGQRKTMPGRYSLRYVVYFKALTNTRVLIAWP